MKYIYLNIIKEIKRNHDTQKNVAKVLYISELTFRKKLAGISEWSIGEIETLCNHFKKDYYELFKRKD